MKQMGRIEKGESNEHIEAVSTHFTGPAFRLYLYRPYFVSFGFYRP